MRERSQTPVVPFPPPSDDARALALAARGMAETFGGTFEDMVSYVITILRDGPYRAAIGPACGIMGEERDGLIVIFDVAATVTPDEVLTAARVLCGAGSGQDQNLTRNILMAKNRADQEQVRSQS